MWINRLQNYGEVTTFELIHRNTHRYTRTVRVGMATHVPANRVIEDTPIVIEGIPVRAQPYSIELRDEMLGKGRYMLEVDAPVRKGINICGHKFYKYLESLFEEYNFTDIKLSKKGGHYTSRAMIYLKTKGDYRKAKKDGKRRLKMKIYHNEL